MDARKPEPGAATAAAAASLEIADKQIASLKDRHLPLVPHLLYVPTKTPYLPEFPFENQNTPFDPSEVMQLQYMTMISNPDRGVGRTRGDWQDDLAVQQAKSPWSVDARSSTSTPNPFRDSKKIAANKISIADYKNMKQTGVKPSPRPATSTPGPESQGKLGHSRNTSATSFGAPMIRGTSFEGTSEVKQNGASGHGSSTKHEMTPVKDVERSAIKSSETDRREKPRSATNGKVETRQRETPQSKEASKDSRAQRPGSTLPARPTLTHALPPRPQSPPRRNNLGLKQNAGQKRPNPSQDTPPEKRTKIEHARTPSNSQNSIPRRPDTPSQTNASSSKPSKATPTSHPSSTTKKDGSTKDSQSKFTSKSDRPRDLPPLLSPLPMELEDPILSLDPAPFADPATSNTKKEGPRQVSSSNTPSRAKVGGDTIVVKGHPERSPRTTPPKPPTQPRARSPLVLPRLLSPGLPEVVELALAEIQKKKSSSKLDTVEARHEKARQPDAPGVARKTPKVKGQAARRSAEEGSREAAPGKLIVKIPYKKRHETDIKRILGMRPRPSLTFLKLEEERKSPETGRKEGLQPSAFPKEDESSDDEGPIVKIKAAESASRKRPIETSNPETVPKRPKIPEISEDVRSQTPVPSAFKSPAVSGPREKGLLATPKKGDAMKSVAMRKVDSSDGMARTPQPTSMSTPASAERSRLNGSVEPRSQPGGAELESLRADEKKYSELALKLKRKMDNLLQTKSKDPQARDAVSEKDRKMGYATGIECVVVYMNSFHLTDRCSTLSNRTHSPAHWNSVLLLLNFLNHSTTNYPVFEAVCAQVGAVCREQLDRQNWDASKDPAHHRDPKFWGAARDNSVKKQNSWEEAERTRPILRELAGDMVLGPWSDVKQVTAYAIGVLTAFSRKEQTGWKRDPGFQ